MTPPLFIRIFLSSPGDVAQERALAIRAIDQLPYDPLLQGKIAIQVVAWDKKGAGVPMLATLTPQEAINQGLPKPSDCAIVIVIFWSRMGTPLPPEYTKPDGSRYLSGTEWEYEDAVQAAKRSTEYPAQPQVVVYRRTEEVSLKPSDPEFMAKYEQWQRVQDFFKTFSNPDGSIRQGYNPYATPDDFREQLNTHLRSLIQRLLEIPPTVPLPTPPIKTPSLWKGSPFPGLRAFTPDDAPIFFGRGRETDDLIARLSNPACRFIGVVGASGSGKSSLVGAGLLPRLMGNAIEGSKDWLWARFTPGGAGDNPFMALASGLISDLPSAKKRYPQPRLLADDLGGDVPKLEALVATILADHPTWADLLLFIDQFEEIFTLAAERYRQPFIDLLDSMAKTPRLRVVATVRADFYHRCVEFPGLAFLLNVGTYNLPAPKAGSLYEMITHPADRAGLRFEDGLAQRILDDTGNDPGALALMAYLLDELYQACCRQDSARLSHTSYEALGGVQGTIGMRAQHVFDSLDAETQAALPHVFRDLVEVDERGIAIRQRAMLNQITGGEDGNAPARLVNALTEAHLLVQSKGTGDYPVVEVAHEALLRIWPRLAMWIAEAQEDLILLRQVRNAADQWERSDRHKAFLWPHERLLLVYAMLERLNPALDEVTRDFIKPEVERLVDELNNPATDDYRRAGIGDRLAEIGDTRPGVDLGTDGLPALVWCDVSGGEVTLEDNAGTFGVQSFKIAKYPITYVQYKAFLDAADGYGDDRWWDGLRHGTKPGQQYFRVSNRPADNVSWFDAMAFCRWLSAKLGYEVRLPTEWEWQQAATGGNPKNVYPWGMKWDLTRANTAESSIGGRTTAVGMYPQGAVFGLGILDMSGNVEEWCLNSYKEPDSTDYWDDLARIVASKDDYESPARRVLRGGDWRDNLDLARVAYRSGDIPGIRDLSIGFRVVLSIPS